MRILGRYIFREILTSSLLGTFLATFVTFLQKADKLFAVLVGANAKPRVVAELFAWSIPQLLPLTIPFGVLVGILIVAAFGTVAIGVVGGSLPPLALLALLGLPVGLFLARQVYVHADDLPRLIPYLGINVAMIHVTLLLLAIGLLFG